jgi:hypothetical protein
MIFAQWTYGTYRLPYKIHNYTAHPTYVEHKPPEQQ